MTNRLGILDLEAPHRKVRGLCLFGYLGADGHTLLLVRGQESQTAPDSPLLGVCIPLARLCLRLLMHDPAFHPFGSI